jgi:hypothetical protein
LIIARVVKIALISSVEIKTMISKIGYVLVTECLVNKLMGDVGEVVDQIGNSCKVKLLPTT